MQNASNMDGMMHSSSLKYCSLNIAGDTYHYALDTDTDTVYTQDFPGIPIQKFHTACGHLSDSKHDSTAHKGQASTAVIQHRLCTPVLMWPAQCWHQASECPASHSLHHGSLVVSTQNKPLFFPVAGMRISCIIWA